MRNSQEIEENITEWFDKQNLGLSIIPINYLLLEHKKVIMYEAKKEVFNDMLNEIRDRRHSDQLDEVISVYEELIKRHLSYSSETLSPSSANAEDFNRNLQVTPSASPKPTSSASVNSNIKSNQKLSPMVEK